MNATEFALYRNDFAYFSTQSGYEDIGEGTPQSKYPFKDPFSLGKGTDWIDEITRTAPYQNYSLSISGRSKKSSYYASLGYNDSQGIIDNSGLQRITGRLNLDHQVVQMAEGRLPRQLHMARQRPEPRRNRRHGLLPRSHVSFAPHRPAGELQPALGQRPADQYAACDDRPEHLLHRADLAQPHGLSRSGAGQGPETAQPELLLFVPAPHLPLLSGIASRQERG